MPARAIEHSTGLACDQFYERLRGTTRQDRRQHVTGRMRAISAQIIRDLRRC
jgi:hypothetical protein